MQDLGLTIVKPPEVSGGGSCCPPTSTAETPSWIVGTVQVAVGPVSEISTEFGREEFRGAFRSRTTAFRMSYAVPPGLYAVGTPGPETDVFVTGNYKLSFDRLRESLAGRNGWVLVLDTKGINVWCAAGKGTFGTDELVRRVGAAKLEQIVTHRRLILPQLGAVGVSAPRVKDESGFTVHYGPVRAADLPAYLDAGRRATPAMRRVEFPLLDRLVLTPMEIRPAMAHYPAFAAIVLVLFGLEPSGVLFREAWRYGFPFLVLGLVSVFAGAFLMPMLLPWIPFRSFAGKGWIAGLMCVLGLFMAWDALPAMPKALVAASFLLFPALSSYIGLQFTGSTTYTGMSGVKKELRFGLPIYAIAVLASLAAVVVYKLSEWGFV